MSLVDDLKESYPIQYFLTLPTLKVNIVFKYTEAVDESLKSEFEQRIRNLGIGITYISTVLPPVEITVDSNEGTPEFIFQDGKILRFKDREPLNAMQWVAYSVSAGCKWIPESKDSDVLLAEFNSGSQKFAASLIYEIQNRLTVVPNIEILIENKTKDYAQYFIEKAPLFSKQVLDENGMEFISSTKKLFKRAEKTELEDLAGILYGDGKSFLGELNGYCRLMKTMPRYKKALEDAAKECEEKILSLPVYRINDSIESAKKKIAQKLKIKDDLENIKRDLRISCNCKKVGIKNIESYFSAVSEEYNAVARKIVLLEFLNDFTEKLSDRVKKTSRNALETLQITNAHLRNFCLLTPNDYGVKISWTSNGEIELEDRKIDGLDWDAQSIRDVQMNIVIPSEYYSIIWFAGENVAKMAKDAGIIQLDSVFSLDSQLLCALMFKDNTAGGAV